MRSKFLVHIWMKTTWESLDWLLQLKKQKRMLCEEKKCYWLWYRFRTDKLLMEAHWEYMLEWLLWIGFWHLLLIFRSKEINANSTCYNLHRKNEFRSRVFNFKVNYYESAKTIYQIYPKWNLYYHHHRQASARRNLSFSKPVDHCLYVLFCACMHT